MFTNVLRMLSIGQRRMRERVDFDDPKEFDDPHVFDDPKGIQIVSMNFDSPKVYGDTFIFDGLVYIASTAHTVHSYYLYSSNCFTLLKK